MEEKQYIYVVLTRTTTLFSRMISIIKKDEYTHAAISLDKEFQNMYSFSRKDAYNPFIGVFKKENFNEGLYRLHKNLPGAIIEIEVTKEQYNKIRELLNDFITNSDKYKYNYIGVINNLFNIASYDDYRFLCSEFVYYILNESGVIDFNIPRNLVRPQKFLELTNCKIYKGNLKLLINKNLFDVLKQTLA